MACSRKNKRKILKNRKKMVRRRQGYLCAKCGKYDEDLEVHHVIFKSQGGDDSPENLEVLCHKCHLALHRKTKSKRRKRLHPITLIKNELKLKARSLALQQEAVEALRKALK